MDLPRVAGGVAVELPREDPDPGDLRRSSRFVTFEGGEGAGKSSQMAGVAGRLRGLGVEVVTTREPGGCQMAERIRELVVGGGPGAFDPRAEWLLMLAARIEHLRAVIRPALARGSWVLCDRFSGSTVAYQGYGRGLDLAWMGEVHRFVQEGLEPDRVILLDVDPEVGLGRALGANRFERESSGFHRRVRAGFLAMAGADPERWRVVDAHADKAVVAEAVWRAVVMS
ncbi:Thymidylate kinase [Candidatus Magnetaquicoccaceae bacterium FCR-1]|uniref:Thymidylate kinase n=1 Tax=Candidatus Magnetaquiglobus chichijimensis TaxID=3141448 RepID=A0ABQ0C8N5_9PROT